MKRENIKQPLFENLKNNSYYLCMNCAGYYCCYGYHDFFSVC